MIEILADGDGNVKRKSCRKNVNTHTDGHTEARHTQMERADVYLRVSRQKTKGRE